MSDYYLLTKSEDIQDDKLKLGKSKRNVNIYHGKQRLFFRTGKLKMPFGVQINKFKTYSDFTEYYIDFSIFQSENVEFLEMLKEMENKIKSLIVEQKMFSDDTLEDLNQKFTGIVKENGGYPPLFKVNLPRKSSGYFDFTVFDSEKETINITDSNIQEVLLKGNLCKIVFEIDKIWFFKDRYGITLKMNQLRLCKKEETDYSKPILDLEDSNLKENVTSNMNNVAYTESMFLDD